MGLFSTIKVAAKCSECCQIGVSEVQFKYGNLWIHEYGLGSEIVWGRTQVGDLREAKVAVEGIGECSSCKVDLYFDIIVEAGVIQSVGQRSGKYDYFRGEGNYFILDDGAGYVPIVYRDFHDVPRIFIASLDQQRFLFDCPFDRAMNEYSAAYEVYSLKDDFVAPDGSWDALVGEATEHLGSVSVTSVQFDPTARRCIRRNLLERFSAKTGG